jgi:hypothetical protein
LRDWAACRAIMIFVMAGGSGKSKQQKSNMAAKFIFILYTYHVDEFN